MAALSPSHLEISDESHRHAGHGAARGGHYAVTIVSAAFEGSTPVARHRLVYRALRDEMSVTVHALALSTFTPAEWEARRADAGGPASAP